jgi:hypothetical protein
MSAAVRLRHSIITLAFAYANVLEVAELGRHANPRVTLTMYAGMTGEGRQRAVAKLVEAGVGG